mmetsp:Transcript_2025/g.4738  ORF Transcript_2025/g.4738 Transcript_2025/m.4738 type:complete len:219 (-) Transcript_2025:475-1131(-)|eukprot:CAMPEP_0178996682 /NCGR_PEP_ID=MMETSP0795-20121207/8503_1 /TAXON_ID=88552 /ORGANISM="Amoebophrya sp., Strain Ameob2" /LENGTH=218 /DNA_ID=CAMNT_0020689097 /DNA_START=123 /DNA_END=779 /DNA_ORIENTATION=+
MGVVDERVEQDMKTLLKEFGAEEELKEHMELQFEEKKFPADTLSEWDTLALACPQLTALGFVNCGLKKVTEPKEPLEQLEVLDLSGNDLEELDFFASGRFSSLVSLTLENCEALKWAACEKGLKELKALKMLDCTFPEFEKDEDMRKKIFEVLPGLLSLNGCDAEGNPMDIEEEDYSELEEEDMDLLNMLEEEDGEEGVEEQEEEETPEPDAKKQKTE